MLLLLILKAQSTFPDLHITTRIAVYYIKHAHSRRDVSVFTEAACVNLPNWICRSSIQESANQPYQFSIFFSIYGHCEQIPELVGSCCKLTCFLVSGGKNKQKKKVFHTWRSLCNREQGDQQNESWNCCRRSNSLATERKRRIKCAAACRVSRALR